MNIYGDKNCKIFVIGRILIGSGYFVYNYRHKATYSICKLIQHGPVFRSLTVSTVN